MRLAARYAARSDIGRHRQTNEDSWLARPPLFAVADGMGGARAGEVASRVALETLAGHSGGVDPFDREAAGTTLMAAAAEANQHVWQLSTEYASRAGMGTTLTALALCADGARLAHIGDSRAYLLRDAELRQLTDDHSLVGEMVRSGELPREHAAGHPLRSILSRALGTEPEPQIDLLDVDLLPGDTLLLCSDGLTGPVADSAIALILAEPDPDDAARRLIDAALREGGPDNITVVVVRLDGVPENAAAAGTVAAATMGEAADRAGAAEAVDAAAAGPVPERANGAQDAAAEDGRTTSATPGTAAETEPSGESGRAEARSAADDGLSAAQEAPAGGGADGDAIELEIDAAAGPVVQPAAATPAPPGEVPAETVERPYLGGAAASDAAARAAAPSELTAPDAGRRRRRLTVLIAIAVLLAALAAAAGIVGQLEWVGVSDDGVVTVYRGVPFEFAGLRLYREHRRTATPYAELDEEQQARVDAHAVGWRGSGEDLATELQSGIP